MQDGLIDCIVTPKQGNRVPDATFCADNGKFGEGWPGAEAWFDWLSTLPASRCTFAVAPDVVGDAGATLSASVPWLARVRGLGLPVAFVAQDGSESVDMIPWSDFDVLFLGGSTDWKLGPAARGLAAEAVARGKRVHMGRVNSLRRLLYAQQIGCSSVDGTYLIFGPDKNLARLLGWLDVAAQPTLDFVIEREAEYLPLNLHRIQRAQARPALFDFGATA